MQMNEQNTTTLPEHAGDLLKRMMHERGTSPVRLGRHTLSAAVNAKTICLLCTGRPRFTAASSLELGRLLGVDSEFFLRAQRLFAAANNRCGQKETNPQAGA